MSDPRQSQHPRKLYYEDAPVVRTSVAEIVLGVIALICGLIFTLLGLAYGWLNVRRPLSWPDRYVPFLVMLAAGVLGCMIGFRALRRWRSVRHR